MACSTGLCLRGAGSSFAQKLADILGSDVYAGSTFWWRDSGKFADGYVGITGESFEKAKIYEDSLDPNNSFSGAWEWFKLYGRGDTARQQLRRLNEGGPSNSVKPLKFVPRTNGGNGG